MKILETFEFQNYNLVFIMFAHLSLALNIPVNRDKNVEEDSRSCSLSDFPWPLTLPSVNYNPDQVPTDMSSTNESVEPLKIFISGIVQTIAPIMPSETEFRVNMKFVLKWTDGRLRAQDACNLTNAKAVLLSDEVTKLIWLPCPHIVNAKYEEIKKLSRKLISVSLSRTGAVTMSMIINATVDCAMNFEWFPMDSQVCPMNIESFLYDNDFVDYNWLQSKPFQVLPSRLLQFDVENLLHYTKSQNYRKQLARNFTRLTVTFRFTRIWSNFFIQTFIPCTIIVSISWFSFWLGLDATSARGALLATSMLTLVTQFLSLRVSLPPVAYIRAVDVWMFGCILSIIAAVAEFTLVKVLYSITEKVRKANSVRSLSTVSLASQHSSHSSIDHNGLNEDLSNQLNMVLYPSYMKKRLGGSAVLSGRSIATSHLPCRLEWRIFCGKIGVPLVWTPKVKQNCDDESLQEYLENNKKLLWRQIDEVSKILFPGLYFLLSFVYWLVLIMFS